VREGKRGADALTAFQEQTGVKIWSLLTIRQAVKYLHQEGLPVLVEGERRPLDDELIERLDEYLAVYGREG
jgi:hypothetical protein